MVKFVERFFNGFGETPLQRMFRVEHGNEWQRLSRQGIRPSDDLIRTILESERK